MTRFTKYDLIGSPHSIVRHPFMPEAIFKEMWDSIEKGKHFQGFVMNLRKDSNHYWVEVFVDPIDKSGEIIYDNSELVKGYVAVRREPSREEIQKAYELYKVMRKAELLAKSTLKDWEKELLKKLDELPEKADDLL